MLPGIKGRRRSGWDGQDPGAASLFPASIVNVNIIFYRH